MTVEEVKARPDYTFDSESLYFYLPEIRSGHFKDFDPVNGRFELGVAFCEVGCVALDVNVTSCDIRDGDDYSDNVVVSYFLGLKMADGEWEGVGYMDDIGYETEVDFNRDDWKDQLENDMVKKIIQIATRYSLSFDNPVPETFGGMEFYNKMWEGTA